MKHKSSPTPALSPIKETQQSTHVASGDMQLLRDEINLLRDNYRQDIDALRHQYTSDIKQLSDNVGALHDDIKHEMKSAVEQMKEFTRSLHWDIE